MTVRYAGEQTGFREEPFVEESRVVFAWHPDLDADARRLLAPHEYESYRRYVIGLAEQTKKAREEIGKAQEGTP